MNANIHPDLLHFAVPVESLVLDPENARLHPEENLDAIARSLVEFGQDQPLVVRETDRKVIKGNGRLEAARRLGWSHLAAVVVPDSHAKAVARALADNRSGELAVWDPEILARALELVHHDQDVSTDATGFTPEAVQAVMAQTRAAAGGIPPPQVRAAAPPGPAPAAGGRGPSPEPPEEFPAYDEDIETEHVCPRCGYSWSGNPAPGGSA